MNMRNIRIWYKKTGSAAFISHLDTNRYMLRAVRRAKLPIWYTEGFNPHPYITFVLPLSLGFESLCECMEVKIPKEVDLGEMGECLRAVMTDGFTITKVAEPWHKVSELCYSDYFAVLSRDDLDNDALFCALEDFLASADIRVEKKTKSGSKEIDIKQEIVQHKITGSPNGVELFLRLPAGSKSNINPMLLVNEFLRTNKCTHLSKITRARILTKEFDDFE